MTAELPCLGELTVFALFNLGLQELIILALVGLLLLLPVAGGVVLIIYFSTRGKGGSHSDE
jgi:hypothetical protein